MSLDVEIRCVIVNLFESRVLSLTKYYICPLRIGISGFVLDALNGVEHSLSYETQICDDENCKKKRSKNMHDAS